MTIRYARAVLCLVVAAGLPAGCRDRAVGTISDGSVQRDAGPDGETRDAEPEGGIPDGWVGCVVPDDPVIIHNETAPAFVHSLDRVGDRYYVLGGSEGWQDMQAGLWLLDPDTLDPIHRQTVSAEMVYASYDRYNDEVVAVTNNDSFLQFIRYEITMDQGLMVTDQRSLCNDCAAGWQGPAFGAYQAAVAVRHFGSDELQVYILPRSTQEVLATQTVQGGTPRLVVGVDAPVLIYQYDQLLHYYPFYWTSDPVHDPRVVSDDPIMAVLDTRAGASNNRWVAVLNSPQDQGVVRLYSDYLDQPPPEYWEVPDVLEYAQYWSISDSGDTVAMAWGETFGEGRVGAHFMAFSIFNTQLIFGPELISDPISHPSASYSVWAAAAPHPDGHAVVWGAWQEQTFHGIYGKIIRCRGFDYTPPL
jgi:hypothetical protein